MDTARFFYKVITVDAGHNVNGFLGSAFPIGPNGTLLTCRHVVDVELPEGNKLAVFDNERRQVSVLDAEPIICTVPNTDIALLPNALNRKKEEFFPILPPNQLRVGEDVYSYGYFAIGGNHSNLEAGYFGGKIVNFFQNHRANQTMFTLPFAIIEGLSGCPVITYHNGPKVVGMATGNRITRILAAEVMEYKDENIEFKETVNRIVEFGTAMHCAALISFLSTIPDAGYLVSDERNVMPSVG